MKFNDFLRHVSVILFVPNDQSNDQIGPRDSDLHPDSLETEAKTLSQQSKKHCFPCAKKKSSMD